MTARDTRDAPSSSRPCDVDPPPRTGQKPAPSDALPTTRQTCQDLYLKYVSLFDFAPIGYLVIDGQDMIHELNLSSTITLSAPRSKLIGRHLTDFIHQDDLKTFSRNKRRCRKRLEAVRFDLKMRNAEGRHFDAQLQMQLVNTDASDIPRYSVALADVSDKVQLSSSLSLQQNCLEAASRAGSQQELLDAFVKLVKTYLACDAVGIRVRDAAGNIPYRAWSGIPVDADIAALDRVRDANTQVCLFRIFQEVLLNVHKHARASRVRLSAEAAGETLRIDMRDDGVGFDVPDKPVRINGHKGMGLSTLALRCRMIGADLAITSRKGAGARLVITLAIDKPERER